MSLFVTFVTDNVLGQLAFRCCMIFVSTPIAKSFFLQLLASFLGVLLPFWLRPVNGLCLFFVTLFFITIGFPLLDSLFYFFPGSVLHVPDLFLVPILGSSAVVTLALCFPPARAAAPCKDLNQVIW